MKKTLIYILVLALLPIFAVAQEQQGAKQTYSIEIDPTSFAPVQTDALSGCQSTKSGSTARCDLVRESKCASTE
ncbi:MAG: hypothetical protein IKL20_05750 [Alistipes sp.]|nr:hypothetical protein [Alistipes sp.]